MHINQWLGVLLILIALLGAFGVTFGVIPVFAPGITVLIGIAGTWLYLKHGRGR